MLNTVFGAPTRAAGNVAGLIQPDPLRRLDADMRRVREAIVRCWNRCEAAKRRCDFQAELGAKDDMERLSLQLADLHAARRELVEG